MSGSRPGERRGGRKKGTRNRVAQSYDERWKRLVAENPGSDIQELAVMILAGKVQCGTCHGKKRTSYVDKDGKRFTRICESCDGTGLEKISIADRLKVMAIIAGRVWPERKAVEVTGEDGGPIEHKIELIIRD